MTMDRLIENIVDLNDIPHAYTGFATYGLAVNAGEDAMEFAKFATEEFVALAIDSGVWQTQGDVLDDLNTLGVVAADNEFIVGTGAGAFAYEKDATVRTSLDVYSIAESDGLVTTHEATYNHAEYDTAYGWGDHAGLYLPLAGGTMAGAIAMGGNALTGVGTIGIGTTTIPHGGVGWAKFAIDGANSDAGGAGPHTQFTTTSDDYPLMQFLMYRHDDISIRFDSYYDGQNRSSDAGSNYAIFKVSDLFKIMYDSGVAKGAALTWNTGISLNASGLVTIPGTMAAGTVTGANVTTGADPGHTHTAYEAAGTMTTHESTYNHANYDTAYGWGDHAGLYETVNTAILKTFVDNIGDLISASADDTPVILGVGGDGTVLTADSGQASGLAWTAAGSGTVDTSGTPVANDFARFTDADTIEGLSYSETLAALSGQAGAAFDWNNQNFTSVGAIACTSIGATGNISAQGGHVYIGVDKDMGGIVHLFGEDAGSSNPQGGAVRFYSSATYEGDVDYWTIHANNDDLEFKADGNLLMTMDATALGINFHTRNLSGIGTIGCGAITSTGAIQGELLGASGSIDIVQASDLGIATNDTLVLTFAWEPSEIVITFSIRLQHTAGQQGHSVGRCLVTSIGSDAMTTNMNYVIMYNSNGTPSATYAINDATNLIGGFGPYNGASFAEVKATGAWSTANKQLTLTFVTSNIADASNFLELVAVAYR